MCEEEGGDDMFHVVDVGICLTYLVDSQETILAEAKEN